MYLTGEGELVGVGAAGAFSLDPLELVHLVVLGRKQQNVQSLGNGALGSIWSRDR